MTIAFDVDGTLVSFEEEPRWEKEIWNTTIHFYGGDRDFLRSVTFQCKACGKRSFLSDLNLLELNCFEIKEKNQKLLKA